MGNLKGRDHLEDLGVDVDIKMDLERNEMGRLDLSGS